MSNVDPIDEYMRQIEREALGLPDPDAPPSTEQLGLPANVQSLDQLPARVAQDFLRRNRHLYPTSTFNVELKRANDRADAEASARSSMEQMSSVLREFGVNDPNVDDDQLRSIVDKSFGEIQSTFLGPTANDANVVNHLFAAVPYLLSSDFRRGRSARANLQGVLNMEAYQSLKGAGAISNFELQQAGPAVDVINNKGTSQEVAYESLLRLDRMNKLAQFRQMNNISVDDATGIEIEVDNNTGDVKRVYTTFNPETNSFIKNDVPTNETVYNFPFVFDEDQFRSFYDSVPDGSIIIREGQAFRKGQ